MNVLPATVIGLAGLALLGCQKKEESRVTAKVEARVAAVADANTPVDAGATRGIAASSFAGKYTVTPGTLYVPADKDWAPVKWKSDDTKLLGEGEMTLAIDTAGRVAGTTTGGPLGAAVIDGTSDGQTLAATLRRKDPADEGLTGTLLAKIAGDNVEGTMKLAEFNAAVVRVASFTATKK
jgi:hypothetical protein